MGKRCVAGFCGHTNKDGYSLFKFPDDPVFRKKWTSQVLKTKREKWSPSKHSVLCCAHFEKECFDTSPALKESLGFSVYRKKQLLPSAIPTIFPQGPWHQFSNERKPTSTKAIEKQEKYEVRLS